MLRLSGPDALRLVGAWCGEPVGARGVRSFRGRLGENRLPVLCAVFPAPRSYTGEDVVEIFLPGHPLLVERVVAELRALAGSMQMALRAAGPGEFTARAFLHERLTLAQAEGVAALIAAESSDEIEEARRLLSGERGRTYEAMASETMSMLALVEAGIDFTDQEDVVAIDEESLRLRCERLIREITVLAGPDELGTRESPLRDTLAKVVLAGAPNAGKSTLLNAMLGRRRAVESPIEGTTRDVLEEEADLGPLGCPGVRVLLCDSAGLAEGEASFDASSAVAAAAGAATRAAIERADVVIWCDPAARFDDSYLASNRAVLRVRTKADLPHAPSPAGILEVSALDGFHLPRLARAIADRVAAGRRGAVPVRHRAALRAAREHLARVAASPQPDELAASSLRAALDSLGELIGRMTPDDVLGRIFSTFCVGK